MEPLPFDTNLVDPSLLPRLGGPPYQLFADWRERDPVHWNPAPSEYRSAMPAAKMTQGFWVVTRYEDVVEVSRDQDRFSSHEGSATIWDFDPEALLVQQAGLMSMPQDQHAAVKRIAMPPFTVAELARFEPKIHAVGKEIVDTVIEAGKCEFVFDVASKLPVYTFCEIMGIPADMRETVAGLGNAAADTENTESTGPLPHEQLFIIAAGLAEEKRKNPDDSIMSKLVHVEVDGERLDDVNIGMFFVTLAIAGHETTRNTAVHFIRLMNDHPEQYALLREDPEKHIRNAIEEVLRISPPVIQFRRTVMEDTQIGERPVKKGDKVYIAYTAANRDPSVFTDPDRFDITRSNANKHLSFGTGPHVCIGARLAHMQLRALLLDIVERMPDFRISGDLTHLPSIWFNAITNMPVEFTPSARGN